jgi:predicted AlkP superfamily pyrophosphatase or phosphodiesterase
VYYSYFKDTSYDADGDDHTVAEATRYIQTEKPDFAFLYIGTVDTAGHAYGWMSNEYLKQLERIDSLFGGFFDSLPSEYTSIVHSDHGGHDRNHGSDSDEDMIIPWMAVGPNIKKGYTIQSPVSLLDTAPTIAKLLELKAHHEWEGKCVDEIFVS